MARAHQQSGPHQRHTGNRPRLSLSRFQAWGLQKLLVRFADRCNVMRATAGRLPAGIGYPAADARRVPAAQRLVLRTANADAPGSARNLQAHRNQAGKGTRTIASRDSPNLVSSLQSRQEPLPPMRQRYRVPSAARTLHLAGILLKRLVQERMLQRLVHRDSLRWIQNENLLKEVREFLDLGSSHQK
jgi:hypothetical protein